MTQILERDGNSKYLNVYCASVNIPADESSRSLVKASSVSVLRLCHTYSLNHHSIYGVRKFAAMCTGAKALT